MQGSHASRRPPEAERLRAEQHIAWLEERLRRARRERWDAGMTAALEAQLPVERRGREGMAAAEEEDPSHS